MNFLKKVDKTIFFVSAAVYALIFLFIWIMPEVAFDSITSVMGFTLSSVGFVYIAGYAVIFISFLGLALSKYGKVTLGKQGEKPEYSFFSWMAMLFICGLGVGIVFFGVTEPMSHFMLAPFTESGTTEAAIDAMRITFFHWTLLPWAAYGIAGLCIAYFLHVKGLPTLVSSSFHPTLGDKIHGTPGKIIDSFSLIALICGISMSLGFAATQFTTGMHYQYGTPDGFLFIVLAAIFIAGVAIASAMSGVGRGIKALSRWNMYIVFFFMIFAFIFGPTRFLISSFFQGMGDFIVNLPAMTLFMDAYGTTEERVGFDWVSGWTIMYWAWWVAFIPFVGGFLASISKGRTIREYVLACTFVPGLITVLWFVFFGGGAIHMDLVEGRGIGERIMANTENSLFVYLAELPIAAITIPIALFLILLMIITSVDSAAYVAGQYSSGGKYIPPLSLRAFWGIFIVVNALLFINIGGIAMLRDIAIVFAFPFMIIVLLMIYNLIKELIRSHSGGVGLVASKPDEHVPLVVSEKEGVEKTMEDSES